MFPIVGMLIVIGGVIGGYVMHHGNLHVLWQPTELIIIGGAALGAFIISSPKKVITLTVKNVFSILGGGPGKKQYVEILALLNRIFGKIRKEGLVSVEEDVENPKASQSSSGFSRKTASRSPSTITRRPSLRISMCAIGCSCYCVRRHASPVAVRNRTTFPSISATSEIVNASAARNESIMNCSV